MMIEPFLKENPEYHLVAEERNRFLGKRRIWIRIIEGRLADVIEVSSGLFGENGYAAKPAHFSSKDTAHDYFRRHGVPEDNYRELIEPTVRIL